MRTRKEILDDLIILKGDLKNLQHELSQYPWDAAQPLVIMDKPAFALVARSYLNDQISSTDLEDWANAIECREDIDFEILEIGEYIFELANPVINGAISKERINEMMLF